MSSVRMRIFLVAFALLLVAGAVLWYAKPALFAFDRSSTLTQYADQVIAVCSKAAYPPSCYDSEIPKLMDKGVTMEEAFTITSIVQSKVKNYYYCHILGHNLAAKETAKNPDNWTNVLARCPVGQCANGCLHGAIQERFKSDVLTPAEIKGLIPQLSTVCEPGHGRDFTGLEQPICYHALGHVGVYVNDAHITAALATCDAISETTLAAGSKNRDSAARCYEGAFMEYFQFMEPEDIALVKGLAPTTTVSAETFCNGFSGSQKAACHRESWPLYWGRLQTSSGIQAFCSVMPDPVYQQDCYNVVFNIVTAKLNYSLPKIVPICEGLPPNREAQCFAHSASRFIDTDYALAPGAVELCAVAAKNGVGDRCYGELLFYASFDYHAGTPELASFCHTLPAPWDTKCLNGEGKNLNRYILDT